MDHGSHAQRIRFAANRSELLRGQSLLAAFTNAARCKNLHDIRAVFLETANSFAELFGRRRSVRHLANRRKYARSRDDSASDSIPNRDIRRRSHALYRSETGHQIKVQILDRVERLFCERLRARLITSIFSKMPV